MPRYRNMNPQQQQRVDNQMASGNYGQGVAGQVAQRRAGRINTLPAAPQPMPQPMPAPQTQPSQGMRPPAQPQAQPQIFRPAPTQAPLQVNAGQAANAALAQLQAAAGQAAQAPQYGMEQYRQPQYHPAGPMPMQGQFPGTGGQYQEGLGSTMGSMQNQAFKKFGY